jgi:hypothetical protein
VCRARRRISESVTCVLEETPTAKQKATTVCLEVLNNNLTDVAM